MSSALDAVTLVERIFGSVDQSITFQNWGFQLAYYNLEGIACC